MIPTFALASIPLMGISNAAHAATIDVFLVSDSGTGDPLIRFLNTAANDLGDPATGTVRLTLPRN